jgi:hypothetical protein
MRGQDQFDADRSDGPIERGRLNAGRNQSRAGLLTRSALRTVAVLLCVLAPPPDAMVLLGNVGQRQEMRERTGDAERLANRQIAQPIGERIEVAIVSGMCALRQCADGFDDREELWTFVVLQYLSEQLAKQSHVIS